MPDTSPDDRLANIEQLLKEILRALRHIEFKLGARHD